MIDTSEPAEQSDESSSEPASDSGEGAQAGPTRRRRRTARRLFPAASFEEALVLGAAIQEFGSGQPIRRLTLFTALNRSPDSGQTRKLITSSGQYGITTGSYVAEWLELTPLGAIATDPNSAAATRLDAQAQLGILGVAPFKLMYEKYKGSRLPAVDVLKDALAESEVEPGDRPECVETFLANARGLGLIRNIGGSEHLLTIETVVEEASAGGTDVAAPAIPSVPVRHDDQVGDEGEEDQPSTQPAQRISTASAATEARAASVSNLDDTCFVVSPIGDEGTEYRKHADLMLGSIIEPALRDLGLRAVRADKISRPGMITRQVIDHVARAKLVIADISF